MLLRKKKKKNFLGPWSVFCPNPKNGKRLENSLFCFSRFISNFSGSFNAF